MSTTGVDWNRWLARWDEQQTRYIPGRERLFTLMLDLLGQYLPADFLILDLACGPGAISQRVLTRFPEARAVAVDMNPVLLKLGQAVLGDMQGRLHWETVNMLEADWVTTIEKQLKSFGKTHFDAILSTTALHWLPPENLVHVYHQLGKWVRPKGLFMNGDYLPYPPTLPTFHRLAEQMRETIHQKAFAEEGAEDYQTWWQALEADVLTLEPDLAHLFEAYHLTETERPRDFGKSIVMLHEAALYDAGFVEVSTVWQEMGTRLLMAIQG